MPKAGHRWKFFRAGGVDQVVLGDAGDLANLRALDQKLWVALRLPDVKGLEFDARTLALHRRRQGRPHPSAGDPRRRRVAEGRAARSRRSVRSRGRGCRSRRSRRHRGGQGILAGAKRILKNLGKADATAITLADVADTEKIFAADEAQRRRHRACRVGGRRRRRRRRSATSSPSWARSPTAAASRASTRRRSTLLRPGRELADVARGRARRRAACRSARRRPRPRGARRGARQGRRLLRALPPRGVRRARAVALNADEAELVALGRADADARTPTRSRSCRWRTSRPVGRCR